MKDSWLEDVKWNSDGLVPVIAQEFGNGKVLMMAWMNREALRETMQLGRATYWSRSKQRLWRKGEKSGHVQRVKQLRLDCDGDTILLEVEQTGLACHTGRKTCFYRQLEGQDWAEIEPVEKDPQAIYGEKS
ncbi:MAG: phosphoribosyl-AMP cyclohydrolase [Gammaproteobacteria bacterium]|nr:phosphoribosyl-AMP cyclohydrolase [Gammaproteobacteria bacterium]